jgi:hypothetical protein
MKISKIIERFIFGKPYNIKRSIPDLRVLQHKYAMNLEKYEVYYITPKQKFKILSSGWFLINAYYPKKIKLLKGEIGANILSRRRYIVTYEV